MEKEENEKMKALARYGKEFGGYRMIDVPKPTCGPEDIIIEIKAAAICGADMKHYKVDNGSDEFNSIRGHEELCLTTALMYAAFARLANREIFSAVKAK